MGKWEDELDEPDKPDKPVNLDTMHCTKTGSGKINLLMKAHFVPGKAVHMQFDDRSYKGHATGNFMMLEIYVRKIFQAG